MPTRNQVEKHSDVVELEIMPRCEHGVSCAMLWQLRLPVNACNRLSPADKEAARLHHFDLMNDNGRVMMDHPDRDNG